jgi:CHAD domain-containing protein
MELELVAQPATVAGLSRLKALGACREGRPRSNALKIVWHDNPQHDLLAAGQTLAEQRGVLRLERVLPNDATWLPAQPAPVIAGSPEPATLPAPLAPLAAFEGRETTSVHRFGDQSVILTVAKGVLRSVTAELPAARIRLSGDEQAVRTAALLIAGAEPVEVPLTSLAADGIALATGEPALARHQGAPVLPYVSPSDDRSGEALTVTDALTHILGHLIDVILANAPLAVRNDAASLEAVHQMRVAVRRARSAVSIFRAAVPEGVLEGVNASLKELGSRLGPTRDWDVFAEETVPVVQQAMPHDERLERLSAAVARRRREHQRALAAWLGSAAFRTLGIELAWFAAARFWHAIAPAAADETAPPPPDLADFAGTVLQHRWKKLVGAAKHIEDMDIPSLHDVRLRAKRMRYAAEMFATLHGGKLPHRFIRRLSSLQNRLGVLNDGAVATHLLAELGGPAGRHAYASGLVTGFLAARASSIRPRIVRAYGKFRRQQAYWS